MVPQSSLDLMEEIVSPYSKIMYVQIIIYLFQYSILYSVMFVCIYIATKRRTRCLFQFA